MLEAIVANLEAHPIAATTLALLLRGQARRTIDDGLVAESSAYSVLQSGPEFEAWRAGRPPARCSRAMTLPGSGSNARTTPSSSP